jgi:NADH-quinone oxidoreductase subunit L
MQGPTTASAIIHAATMVAAGVFLTARVYPILTPDTLLFISWIGGITCLFAATCATVQWDLKAVLAYSTVSQLGFMMLGLGAGLENHGLAAGISHLFTHAMFKCMLFLCAAAVIHACRHHQDLGKLGGLKAKMPLIAAVMGVGVLAISGVPGFSGFYSKDSVLSAAYLAGGERQASGGCMVLSWVPFFLGLITAGLTAYYMTRLWVRAFTGTPRDTHIQEHAHDPWPRAKVVLVILAVFCLQAVWTRDLNPLSSHAWLDDVLQPGGISEADYERFHLAHTLVALSATAMLILGMSAAVLVFWYYPVRMKVDAAAQLSARWPFTWLRPLFARLWYFEYLYDQVFTEGFGLGVGRVVAVGDLGTPERLKALESKSDKKPSAFSVDGLADGVGRALAWIGRGLNRVQSGRTSDYAAWAGLITALCLSALLLW